MSSLLYTIENVYRRHEAMMSMAKLHKKRRVGREGAKEIGRQGSNDSALSTHFHCDMLIVDNLTNRA
jgi:hypothetical protein